MSDELIKAVRARIEMGRSNEEIINELIAVGYEEAFAQTVYLAARPINAWTPVEATVAETVKVDTVSAVSNPSTEKKSVPSLVTLILSVNLLVLVGFSTYFYLKPPAWWLAVSGGNQMSSEEFITLVLDSFNNMQTAKLQASLGVSMSDREPGVRVYDDTASDGLTASDDFTLDDYRADITMAGNYDVREIFSPNTEVALKINLLSTMKSGVSESLGIDIEGRLVSNEGAFIRLNELELPFLAFFVDLDLVDSLYGTWVKVAEPEEFMVEDDLSLFQRDLVDQISSRTGTIIFEEMAAHNFVQVTRLESVRYGGLPAQRITHQFDSSVLPVMLRRIHERLVAEFGSDSLPLSRTDLESSLSQLDTKMLAYARDHFTYTITISNTGLLLQYEIAAKFAPDNFDYAGKQLNILFKLDLTEHNQPILVSAPAQFITAEEAWTKLMGSSSADVSSKPIVGSEISVSPDKTLALKQRLSSMRAQAELFYNRNSYSYSGVCADANTREVIQNDFSCKDSPNSYRIIIEWEGRWLCIDSTGAFTDYASAPPRPENFYCDPRASQINLPSSLVAAGDSWRDLLKRIGSQIAGVGMSVKQ